ncbi:MAG: DUF2784 domain-containing protein [Acidobacteria bacterium]|nr:DUF2784 domain-containing protein [Acidobacteriota bacterium]
MPPVFLARYNKNMIYEITANLIALIHFAFLAFVVFGAFLGRASRFWRYLHLSCMLYGVFVEVFYWYCPLTYLEQRLREKAGWGTYSEPFIAHYLNRLIYLDVPQWSLILAAAIVLGVNLSLYLHWSRPQKHSST